MPTSIYSPRPKTSHRVYEQSNWSFGWEKSPKNNLNENPSGKYIFYSSYEISQLKQDYHSRQLLA